MISLSTMIPELAYWVGAAADGWTTERALDRGAKEANPIGRFFIERFGDRGIILVKILGWVVMRWLDAPDYVWWFLGIGQVLVALWNLRILLRLKKKADAIRLAHPKG